jgi:hypothetical protein
LAPRTPMQAPSGHSCREAKSISSSERAIYLSFLNMASSLALAALTFSCALGWSSSR